MLDRYRRLSDELRLAKATCHYELGEYYCAKKDLLRMQRQEGMMLACCYYNLGNLKDADREFRRLLGQHPQDPVLLFNLGCLYARRNNPSSAVTFFRKALAVEPGMAEAEYNMYAVLRLCDQRDSQAHLRRALEL
jgi:Flp pilus assembly protein TadD